MRDERTVAERRESLSLDRLNRPEKSKACEKCDELEKLLDAERKANTQLKRLVEQKGTPNGPCASCPDLKQLLEIEKKNNGLLIEQFVNEKKRTEEERAAKEVREKTRREERSFPLRRFSTELWKARMPI